MLLNKPRIKQMRRWT